MTFLQVKILNSSVFRYTQNGILHMLDRNKRIKPRPERFQNCKDVFDLILTCEERVYDQVVEGKELELINQVNFEWFFFSLLTEVLHKSGNISVSSNYWNTSEDKSLQLSIYAPEKWWLSTCPQKVLAATQSVCAQQGLDKEIYRNSMFGLEMLMDLKNLTNWDELMENQIWAVFLVQLPSFPCRRLPVTSQAVYPP